MHTDGGGSLPSIAGFAHTDGEDAGTLRYETSHSGNKPTVEPVKRDVSALRAALRALYHELGCNDYCVRCDVLAFLRALTTFVRAFAPGDVLADATGAGMGATEPRAGAARQRPAA